MPLGSDAPSSREALASLSQMQQLQSCWATVCCKRRLQNAIMQEFTSGTDSFVQKICHSLALPRDGLGSRCSSQMTGKHCDVGTKMYGWMSLQLNSSKWTSIRSPLPRIWSIPLKPWFSGRFTFNLDYIPIVPILSNCGMVIPPFILFYNCQKEAYPIYNDIIRGKTNHYSRPHFTRDGWWKIPPTNWRCMALDESLHESSHQRNWIDQTSQFFFGRSLQWWI